MKVYLQSDRNGFPIDENVFRAYKGFENFGFECLFYFGDSPKGLERDVIVVGYINQVRMALGDDFPKAIDYPFSLRGFYGREIFRGGIGDIAYPMFVKPTIGKYFNGRVVSSFADMIGVREGCQLWLSECVDFVSEYRCFLLYGEIVGVHRYKGDCYSCLDSGVVKDAVASYKNAPNGCSIDFGVTIEGKTLVVEVNDGYSLGCYNLSSSLYARLISARWAQMTGTKDWLK